MFANMAHLLTHITFFIKSLIETFPHIVSGEFCNIETDAVMTAFVNNTAYIFSATRTYIKIYIIHISSHYMYVSHSQIILDVT